MSVFSFLKRQQNQRRNSTKRIFGWKKQNAMHSSKTARQNTGTSQTTLSMQKYKYEEKNAQADNPSEKEVKKKLTIMSIRIKLESIIVQHASADCLETVYF